MSGVDRETVAMLLAISAEQIAAGQINDVNLHIRDTHRQSQRHGDRRFRTITVTMTVEGDHGDAWYAASTRGRLLPHEIAKMHALPMPEPDPAPAPTPADPKRLKYSAGPWDCGHCGTMNGAGTTTCRACGK